MSLLHAESFVSDRSNHRRGKSHFIDVWIVHPGSSQAMAGTPVLLTGAQKWKPSEDSVSASDPFPPTHLKPPEVYLQSGHQLFKGRQKRQKQEQRQTQKFLVFSLIFSPRTMLSVSISDWDNTSFIFASSLFPMCMLN